MGHSVDILYTDVVPEFVLTHLLLFEIVKTDLSKRVKINSIHNLKIIVGSSNPSTIIHHHVISPIYTTLLDL